MYFVDRKKIEETLQYIERIMEELSSQNFTSATEKWALERMVHGLIEGMLDVGNMMIDGFIMRDPGSYADIIDILIDEKVLPQEEETGYKALIALRKMLVTSYTAVDHEELLEVIRKNQTAFTQFSSHIRKYLDNELGVAHAFSNE
ncbi:DUF86 domain-containing protein [Lentibacillus sediminis]|uniref:DUF86 domain-containing protein n=1 Tax=Lentibacillus sediminis TaxID=1940529 RepID=UPI000C1BE825|nr:DUF86 domain-containing protein [Lentibacillus sediminis]